MVFAILEDGSRWSEWAGLFVPQSSWAVPGDPPGSVGSVRKLGLGPMVSLERVVEHRPPSHLAYVVVSPSPYRDYRAEVDLTPVPDGGTRIVWQGSFTPNVRGTGRALRWLLRSLVSGFARNLAKAADRPQAPPAPG